MDNQREQRRLSDSEEDDLIKLYYKALSSLSKEHKKWGSNYSIYARWSHERRLVWIQAIQASATAGLPMAREIVARATQIRLNS